MWAVISASVIGTAHETNENPCQDSCHFLRVRIAEEEVLLAAVADGAGSASLSQVGSSEAVRHLLGMVVSDTASVATIDAAQVKDWFRGVLQHLNAVADRESVPLGELACTLLLAIVWRNGAVFAQIGDGAWVVERGGQLEAGTWPHMGEYANVTVFVTTKGVLEFEAQSDTSQFQFRRLDGPIDAIAGFTDGLQSLALDYARRTPFEPFFRGMFTPLRAVEDEMQLLVPLRQLLASEVITSRTDDDKTLVLGVWREPLPAVNRDGTEE